MVENEGGVHITGTESGKRRPEGSASNRPGFFEEGQTRRTGESVILVEILLLLLSVAVLRLVLAPGSRSLSTVVMLWILLVATSYVVGEFETAVRVNFGLSLKTQAAFALTYVAYSGIHVVWPWCEYLPVRFWLGLWLYLNLVAPLLGLIVRRLIRQRALLVSDRHANKLGLMRWWGFEVVDTVGLDGFADRLRGCADEYGRIADYDVIVVDIADYRTEFAAAAVASDYFADFIGVPAFSLSGYMIGPHPRHIGPYAPNIVARRVKRIIDLVVVGIGIVLASPLLLGVVLAVKLGSPGPALYRHRRLGRNMREFWLLKFRTMYRDADERLKRILETDPERAREFRETFKLKDDPRVTRIGRFLRKTSMDELPQLLNVIADQMSLVGPRPIVEKEVEYYRDYSLLLFRVLPGATGLWQVSGRSETSYQQRVELDTRYVREWSLWKDVKILCKTVPVVLRRRGAY